ncbi:MAG: PHP domain-containing protein [Nanoarchaeota archaeon]|nr:PHP domain-containing protein [Nanoarchaeota archaeon]
MKNKIKEGAQKFDLHSHTVYSKHWFWGTDALDTPQRMVKAAIKRGMSGLAITDHQTVKGSLVAKKFAKRCKGFIILTGTEIRTLAGDVVALGIKEDVPDDLSLADTIERIHALGGIAVAAHPFAKFIVRKCVGYEAKRLDAIEVFNAGSCKGFQNRKAAEYAGKFGMPKSAGSDAHCARDAGRAGIICGARTQDDVLESVMKKRCEIFGEYTPYKDLAYLSIMKFSRSLKSRI